MTLCGVAAILLVALVLVELGASRRGSHVAVGLLALSPIALGPVSLNTYDALAARSLHGARALLAPARPRRCSASGCSGSRSRRSSTRSCSCRSRPLRLAPRRPAAHALALGVLRRRRRAGRRRRSPRSRPAASGTASTRRPRAGCRSRASARACCSSPTGSALYDAHVVERPASPARNLARLAADAVSPRRSCSRRSPSRRSGCSTRGAATLRARLRSRSPRRRRLPRLHEGPLAAVPRLADPARPVRAACSRRRAAAVGARARPDLVLPLPRALPARVAAWLLSSATPLLVALYRAGRRARR